MKSKQFFIRYTKNGKTYYKNQNGKRASAKTVKRSKKAVYVLNQRTGEIIKPERKKIQQRKPKQTKGKKATVLKPFNSEVSSEIKRAVEKDYKIYIKISGKTYEVKSKEAKNNLLLFNFELNSNFYQTLKKKITSPLFDLEITESKKDKTILFDLDSINLDEANLEGRPEIKAIFDEFITRTKTTFNKYFSKNEKGKKK